MKIFAYFQKCYLFTQNTALNFLWETDRDFQVGNAYTDEVRFSDHGSLKFEKAYFECAKAEISYYKNNKVKLRFWEQ